MGTLTVPLMECEDAAWFRDSESLAAAARSGARSLAQRAALLPERVAEVALAVSEAATNLRRHAKDGSLLLRVVRTDSEAALECVTLDHGPGMPDIARALTDGVSSGGTLGIGLGAISRLADTFDVHSLPGRGTVMTARFWNRTPGGRLAAAGGEAVVTGITRPMSGQELCGDAWAARTLPSSHPPAPVPSRPYRSPGTLDWSVLTGTAGRPGPTRSDRWAPVPAGASTAPPPEESGAFLVMFCDGLGHGPLAAKAALDAVAAFRHTTATTPDGVLADIHHALRSGRGGAVAVGLVEPAERRVGVCGVGNISTFTVDPATGARRSLPSAPGIVGHQLPALRTVRQQLAPGSAVVMHSDGLTDRWQAAALPGMCAQLPVTAAALLLREAGVRRDDAGVLVAKGLW
ncbi:serine/threonine protein kinase [Kitasatospora sp. MMS16-BH015]|uniref:ATP-binding SpoIIE family protein phosphatase n=1 Tax=Kitasatospora sp. MMS16-BH015 TaxID=2018025 RepID=UPI000CA2F52D|nr:ATP-binding SpoIIE family protein phosphatase [Kitasatospora sp. MMS16-BH015]AUG75310.1 serine/threonine protein kinase [Kitasatospora sp. MMS16-BH015]